MKRYKSRFKHYSEKRRNPEMNPHISAWDYVDKYKNDPDVYISFTQIDKIGINPRSIYNTPNGIYCYPLREFIKTRMHRVLENPDFPKIQQHHSIGFFAPFAGNAKYINFIRVKDKANFIDDMYKDYGSNKYDRDIKILKSNYKENLFKLFDNFDNAEEVWEDLVNEALDTAKSKNPVVAMWNITRLLAKEFSNNEKQASTKWNLILSKDLGYSGFADKSGKGYIHPSEPMQAVFFNTRAFSVITRVENVPAKKKGTEFLFKIGDTFRDTETAIGYEKTFEISKRVFEDEPEYQIHSFLNGKYQGKGWRTQSDISSKLKTTEWKKIK